MQVKLTDLRVGERAKILGFNTDADNPNNHANIDYQHRLLVMGLVPDVEFTVQRIAPLGDPVELRIQDFSLCIRKKEAAILVLEKLE